MQKAPSNQEIIALEWQKTKYLTVEGKYTKTQRNGNPRIDLGIEKIKSQNRGI